MALRKILTNDDPTLYKKCRPVEKFDDRLFTLLDDMADTMYHAEGVGLAAPQIGVLRRVVVIDCGDGLMELINPEIIETEGEVGEMEACLSFPGQQGYVVRPQKVTLKAQDRNGDTVVYVGEDLLARAFMHETDHLDGRVYLTLATEAPEEYLRAMEEEE
ncbi:MAG: peptide deformylase [Clostridia bacterium]|nr:peptide deformylase [Clostridia bacterium]